MLSEADISAAKSNLVALWSIMHPEPACGETSSQPHNSQSVVDDEPDDLDLLLKQSEKPPKETSSRLVERRILTHLDAFEYAPRLDKKANVLEYWDNEKTRKPELYLLASVALAVPVTQVSVERTFSSLKYVLSPYRANLKPDRLEQVLLARCNEILQ
jgi:bifunctional polynucleotide phosphatase/kinase